MQNSFVISQRTLLSELEYFERHNCTLMQKLFRIMHRLQRGGFTVELHDADLPFANDPVLIDMSNCVHDDPPDLTIYKIIASNSGVSMSRLTQKRAKPTKSAVNVNATTQKQKIAASRAGRDGRRSRATWRSETQLN
jgi:hypothetical protein